MRFIFLTLSIVNIGTLTLSSNTIHKKFEKKPILNLVGFVKAADGIGQILLSWINVLYPLISIQFLKTKNNILKDIPKYLHTILNTEKKLRNIDDIKMNNSVIIFADLLSIKNINKLKNCSNDIIKLAYSMTEYTQISEEWVIKLNEYFDGVIVPDEFLITIYKNCGVKIPIFSLPLALNIDSFFNFSIKKSASNPFIFGCSADFRKRKNHINLIEAFAKEFGNQENVILKLHARCGDVDAIKEQITKLNMTNIEIIYKSLTKDEYINFISSLDCYVLISKGEGFSITPREALASGIPCILSNNTTHETICNANIVYSIPSNIIEPAYVEHLKQYSGYDFNCEIEDVRKALRTVYQNYDYFLKIAITGRNWVKQYLAQNLRPKYLNFIKPKKIILGNENKVTNDYLMTDSQILYVKYLNLLKKNTNKL